MKSPLSLAIAGLLATTMAAPVVAQPYSNDETYQQQLRDYERQRQIYEQAQRDYDQRYGVRQAPAPDRRYDGPRSSNDPYRRYADSPCERRRDSSGDKTAGTLIGALIGGALGYNVSSDRNQTGGAVLGAVVGGAIGNSIASNDADDRYVARCDNVGYYYTYEQTYPYDEDRSMRGRRSGRYDMDYYMRQRCRLAVAPTDRAGRTDYRYVRVCPDRDNHYRITD